MKHKKITVENSYEIDIYDDLFPMTFRQAAHRFFKDSLYQIGFSDSADEELAKYDQHLNSVYDEQDIAMLGINSYIKTISKYEHILDTWQLETANVNLTTYSDANQIHTHEGQKIFLYYGNLNWKDGAHGETIFYNNARDEVEYTSPYTPGRLIVFDGEIPHTIRPQSVIGPKYRFTFAQFYNKPREI